MNHGRLCLLRHRWLALLLQLGRSVRFDLRLRSSLPLRLGLRLLLLSIGLYLLLRLPGAYCRRAFALALLEPLLLLEDLEVSLLSLPVVAVVILLRKGSLRLLTKDRLRCPHCRHRQLGAAPTDVRKPERAKRGVPALELLVSCELVGRESATRLRQARSQLSCRGAKGAGAGRASL